MTDDFYTGVYNPDVLSCLANLSNDEVFTPPGIANQMLDLLPQDLFQRPDTKFLDPACKSGVLLREIAKRLLKGLEPSIPDLQQRTDHIFRNQLYGIAITELTSLLSRRGVYCSKYPNSDYSVTRFNNAEGNIRFKRLEHQWNDGRCVYCGANQVKYDRDLALETHAYEFLHTTRPEEIFKMKFDVIIGNPPYQLNVGNTSGNSSKAKAIYHIFVSQAKKLQPHYLVMITPSRWMTRSTEGISDDWIDDMLNDRKIRIVHDFLDSSQVFPGVNIMGGVNFFLWDKDFHGDCRYYLHRENEVLPYVGKLDALDAGIVIRDLAALKIIEKIQNIEGQYHQDENKSFMNLVSPKDFFTNKQSLTSSWMDYRKTKNSNRDIKYYLNKNIHKVPFGWVSESQIPKNITTAPLHKVYISAACGSIEQVLGNPFYGEPNSVCSQTYLVIGYDPEKHKLTKVQCENIITYIKTKFFRYLVSIKKKTQNGPRGVYQFVPIQDFSKPWIDEDLYRKYGLNEEEITFIETTIKPMGFGGDDDASE